jgi:hypothetical protein
MMSSARGFDGHNWTRNNAASEGEEYHFWHRSTCHQKSARSSTQKVGDLANLDKGAEDECQATEHGLEHAKLHDHGHLVANRDVGGKWGLNPAVDQLGFPSFTLLSTLDARRFSSSSQ